MKRMLLLTAAMVLAPGLYARAALIPTETSITGSDGMYTWFYSVDLADGLIGYAGVPIAMPGMNTAAYFTIYDFAGFIPGTCVSPDGWGCSTQNSGLTPASVLPQDDPNIVNVTWSYLTGDPLTGGLDVDGFSAMSQFNAVGMTEFAGSASRATGGATGTSVASIGNVGAPNGGAGNPGSGGTGDPPSGGTNDEPIGDTGDPPTTLPPNSASVPEPGALPLLGAALLGLGFIRRRVGFKARALRPT